MGELVEAPDGEIVRGEKGEKDVWKEREREKAHGEIDQEWMVILGIPSWKNLKSIF